MKADQYGQIEVTEDEAFESLYSNKISSLDSIFIEDLKAIDQYNLARRENADAIPVLHKLKSLSIPIEEFDKINQENWFMPQEYKDFEIVEFLLAKTTNDIEYQRVLTELELFVQHNMIDILKYLKYLVDTMRKNNIVWGVGRGSSVASYCLYLLGVHKINSIKYDLDIKEFLK